MGNAYIPSYRAQSPIAFSGRVGPETPLSVAERAYTGSFEQLAALWWPGGASWTSGGTCIIEGEKPEPESEPEKMTLAEQMYRYYTGQG